MVISIVVAYGDNRVIGKDNKLLWSQKNDMKQFKKITEGKTVLMGKNTYLSLPPRFRPLPNRKNVVISTKEPVEFHENLTWYRSIEEALEQLNQQGEKEIMVIGGASIYEQMLPMADYLFATHIRTSIDGDAYFPTVDDALWIKLFDESHEKDSDNDYAYHFQLFKNKQTGGLK